MVQINYAAREINCKIVYYGPGRSGKTTNLEQVHSNSPQKCVGEMVSIATETDRTLFFDFLPLDIGKVAGMQVRFQLYTVPGQVYYNATRKLVLQGVDGVIFVADSQRSMLEENIESLNNLFENLRENGYDPETVPLVLQWNKNDLPDLLPMEELEEKLNPNKYPSNTGVASEGKGVFETLKKIAVLVLDKLNKECKVGGSSAKDKPEEEKTGQRPAVQPGKPSPQESGATPVLKPVSAPPTPAASPKKPSIQPAKRPAQTKASPGMQKKAPASPLKSGRGDAKKTYLWVVIGLVVVTIAVLAGLIYLLVR